RLSGGLLRWIPGVLGPLPPGRRQLLRRRWLPDAADMEPSVVRRLPLGVHDGVVAAAQAGAADAAAAGRAPGPDAVIRGRPAAGAGAVPGPGQDADGRTLRGHPCPGR